MLYLTADGVKVDRNDTSRLVWYGWCGYWTDDWKSLDLINKIPACPFCGAYGKQVEFTTWDEDAHKVSDEYVRFINLHKQVCLQLRYGTGDRTIFDNWVAAGSPNHQLETPND